MYLLPYDLVKIVHEYYASHYMFENTQKICAEIRWKRVNKFLTIVFDAIPTTDGCSIYIFPLLKILQEEV